MPVCVFGVFLPWIVLLLFIDVVTKVESILVCTKHVTHHTSHITRHTSHVTRHTSHISPTIRYKRIACAIGRVTERAQIAHGGGGGGCRFAFDREFGGEFEGNQVAFELLGVWCSRCIKGFGFANALGVLLL